MGPVFDEKNTPGTLVFPGAQRPWLNKDDLCFPKTPCFFFFFRRPMFVFANAGFAVGDALVVFVARTTCFLQDPTFISNL